MSKIIPLYAIDEMMMEAFDSDEFQDYSKALIGSELHIYVDADEKEMENKTNYIYMANFEKAEDKEQSMEEFYKTYIDVAIELQPSVTIGRVTRKEDKKRIELLSLKAMEIMSETLNFDGLEWVDVNDVERNSRDLRLLGLVTGIAETKNTKNIKLVLSLTFGNINKTLGVCR